MLEKDEFAPDGPTYPTTFVGSTTFLSASQVLFSTQTGYNISSVLGFVSSLQVDELQIGTGFGIIAFGDTNMSSISTLGIAAGLGNFQTINVSSITVCTVRRAVATL